MLEKKPDTTFCVFCQKNKDTELPYEEDLYPVGVFAKLIKVIKMPGTDQMSIIIQDPGSYLAGYNEAKARYAKDGKIAEVEMTETEMKTAELLSGVDGAFLFDYHTNEKFQSLTIFISVSKPN